MNIAHRFTLLVKGSINAVLDSIEDPERSLHQLILDMEEELDAAKRAAARAMANEDRIKAKAAFHEQDARQWQAAATRSLAQDREAEAKESLRRLELAERQRERLLQTLASQAKDTAEIRESVARMNERVAEARARLAVLQARIRQGEARRAMNRVMQGADGANLMGEFERLGERVEEMAASERAYQRLDDEMSGADLKRRVEQAEVDEAVLRRLAEMRGEPAPEK